MMTNKRPMPTVAICFISPLCADHRERLLGLSGAFKGGSKRKGAIELLARLLPIAGLHQRHAEVEAERRLEWRGANTAFQVRHGGRRHVLPIVDPAKRVVDVRLVRQLLNRGL